MDIRWEEFWWNNITGPHVVVSKVADALLENNIVVLRVPSDIPWRHAMRSSIYTAFQEKTDSHNVVIEPVDISDDNPEQVEPGRFILQKFASNTINKGYREHAKTSIQEYISVKKVIRNRIIWVKGFDREQAINWIKFCQGIKKRSVEDGLFVLEIHSDVPSSDIGNMKLIDFSEHVTSYDVQLFNSFRLDDQDFSIYSSVWKDYISTLAAIACDVDAEVSELLIRLTDFKHESIIYELEEIANSNEFSRRGERNPAHVLYHCRTKNSTELERRVWSAQIKVLFPIIELERVNLISKWKNEIQKVLDDEKIIQYGEHLIEAIDAELGTLCYLLRHQTPKGFYSLYIPNEEDRKRIVFLHNCRNKLAHASCCSTSEVLQLLD